jgi:hypothetical protein
MRTACSFSACFSCSYHFKSSYILYISLLDLYQASFLPSIRALLAARRTNPARAGDLIELCSRTSVVSLDSAYVLQYILDPFSHLQYIKHLGRWNSYALFYMS